MSEVIKFKQTPSESVFRKKKGLITGVQDRSEVEKMIQRYLELAASALKKERAPDSEEEVSA